MFIVVNGSFLQLTHLHDGQLLCCRIRYVECSFDYECDSALPTDNTLSVCCSLVSAIYSSHDGNNNVSGNLKQGLFGSVMGDRIVVFFHDDT